MGCVWYWPMILCSSLKSCSDIMSSVILQPRPIRKHCWRRTCVKFWLLPNWVRCERLGNTVIGSISPDGTQWTGVSTQTVAMASASYLAGLHVCSFNTSLRSTSVFDNVTITNLQAVGTVGAQTGANIGSTSLSGSATVAGSTYTVAGAGDNVEGTTD